MTDPAKCRFIALGMIRLGGAAIAMAGIALTARRWIEPADIIGAALIVTGAAMVIVVPTFLARRWRDG